MKVIASNIINEVTTSSANANYPVANLLDKHPKKLWKAESSAATLTFDIRGTSNALMIFNTNATGVTYSLFDPNYTVWESGISWESGIAWHEINPTITETSALDGISGSCMVQWDELIGNVSLTVAFVADENLFAGVAVAGDLQVFSGPSYNFTERSIDYSDTKQLSNGAIYVNPQDVVRAVSLKAMLSLTEYKTLFNICKTLGSYPTAWVVTNENDSWWMLYGMITKSPNSSFTYSNLANFNFELTEVV